MNDLADQFAALVFAISSAAFITMLIKIVASML